MKENIKKLQKSLKDLGWKRKTSTWYFENGPYCFMIGFQKSNFSSEYYIELAYTPTSEDKEYKYYSSYFRERITSKNLGFAGYSPDNVEQTTSLKNEFERLTKLIINCNNKDSVKSFIMNELILSELGLNPRQKEQIELIP